MNAALPSSMFFVLGGASGSGKSTLLPLLRHAHPDVRWHDFDERWSGGGTAERQRLLQHWMETALAHKGHFGLLGQCPLGEVLAAPAAVDLPGVRHLLLDVGDVERIRRLRARGDGAESQDMLSWAAWLRAHQAYPEWRPDVLTDGGWEGMRWERWIGQAEPFWPGETLDSTALTLERTAQHVGAWLQRAPSD